MEKKDGDGQPAATESVKKEEDGSEEINWVFPNLPKRDQALLRELKKLTDQMKNSLVAFEERIGAIEERIQLLEEAPNGASRLPKLPGPSKNK